MKKKYVTPDAKMFEISLEEKIAATCNSQYFYTYSNVGCNSQQVATGMQCYIGTPGQS